MRPLGWLAAIAFVGFAVWLFTMSSAADDRAKAYSDSVECTAEQPAKTCRQRLAAVVGDKKSVKKHRSHSFTVMVRASDGDIRTVHVDDRLYNALTIGQAIEIERWDNSVTKVFVDKKPIELPQMPKSLSSRFGIKLAATVMLVGLASAIFLTWRKRRRSSTVA